MCSKMCVPSSLDSFSFSGYSRPSLAHPSLCVMSSWQRISPPTVRQRRKKKVKAITSAAAACHQSVGRRVHWGPPSSIITIKYSSRHFPAAPLIRESWVEEKTVAPPNQLVTRHKRNESQSAFELGPCWTCLISLLYFIFFDVLRIIMLSSNGNPYLRPEYLNPPPATNTVNLFSNFSLYFACDPVSHDFVI